MSALRTPEVPPPPAKLVPAQSDDSKAVEEAVARARAGEAEASPTTGVEPGRELRHALEQLPEDQREVLVLRHIAGLSPLEIAATLGKTESTVHGLHHRGRRSLQARLTDLSEQQTALEELIGDSQDR